MQIDKFNEVIEDAFDVQKNIEKSFSLEELQELQDYVQNSDDYSDTVKTALSVSILAKTVAGVAEKMKKSDSDAQMVSKVVRQSDPGNFIIIALANLVSMIGLLLILS